MVFAAVIKWEVPSVYAGGDVEPEVGRLADGWKMEPEDGGADGR
jgi:hypothetical protein